MGGSVVLVGAGPGNAGLMTLRGKQVLESAEVVLYDRLAGEEVLAMIPDRTLKIDVGKSVGRHPIPQSEINALLLRYAKEGKTVVRLKGGDPYLFGRGAEELEAIAAEGIHFEVVPGVTSAIAVPAFAGIPVSHRDYSSSVHIITAHKKNGSAPDFDYKSLVGFGGTLVFLMGLGTIEAVTSGLLDAGMPTGTPAALIENGTRPNQRKLVSTIAEIAVRMKEEDFIPPSILLVGGVCDLSEKFDWYSRLPLCGVNIIVTRPASRGVLSQKLHELGANVVDFPCIRIEPLALSDSLFEDIFSYGWIVFTSPAGAEIFFDELKARAVDVRKLYGVKFAAIGQKTAGVLTERGIHADYIPTHYNARELAAGLPYRENESVLLFRAEEGTPQLSATLREKGFAVEDVAVYKTIRERAGSEHVQKMVEDNAVDCVTFTSVSTVQGFTAAMIDTDMDCTKLTAICIGEETAAEAHKHGFRVVISKQATIESMTEKILEECKR